MRAIKQVIHYPDTNSVEATWVDRETISGEMEDGTPLAMDKDVQIRCHSYADVQMQMFRDDVATYGGDISEYEALIAEVEANIQPPVPAPVIIPSAVTMRQARLALLQSDLLSQVNTAVAAADEATKITWEFSTEVQRGNALVATLTVALGLTEQQVDDLFVLAATL